MVIIGPDYKDEKWCLEHFKRFVGDETGLPAYKPIGGYTLEKLAKFYPSEWADFCILEGITTDIDNDLYEVEVVKNKV